MIALNVGSYVQMLLFSDIGPALIEPLWSYVATEAIDVREAFVGQTEPPLTIVILNDQGLFTATSHNYFCKLVIKDGATVRNAAATFSLDSEDRVLLSFALLATDLVVAGQYEYQFRAEDAGTGAPLKFHVMPLIVRSVV